jgi:hypothetical protein
MMGSTVLMFSEIRHYNHPGWHTILEVDIAASELAHHNMTSATKKLKYELYHD